MSRPPIVYIHGLGGSHHNWSLLAPKVGRGHAIDLAGFGLRPAAGRGSSTVAANTALVRAMLADVREPVILVGNSMGAMISIMVAAAAPELVAGLVLIDPVLPRAAGVKLDRLVRGQFLAQLIPGVGELALRRRLARIPARHRVEQTLRLCTSDYDRLPASAVDEMVELEELRVAKGVADPAAFLAASRSLLRVLARPRAYWRQMAAVTAPVLHLHGLHDRLVPIGSARAAHARLPHWTYAELDAGHIPQLETPDEVAAHVTTWMEKHHA
jgi:pimeloyl-ACP methyl ester carboxylesterase